MQIFEVHCKIDGQWKTRDQELKNTSNEKVKHSKGTQTDAAGEYKRTL